MTQGKLVGKGLQPATQEVVVEEGGQMLLEEDEETEVFRA